MVTQIKITDQATEDLLDQVREHVGVHNVAEAVRVALRHYKRSEIQKWQQSATAALPGRTSEAFEEEEEEETQECPNWISNLGLRSAGYPAGVGLWAAW